MIGMSLISYICLYQQNPPEFKFPSRFPLASYSFIGGTSWDDDPNPVPNAKKIAAELARGDVQAAEPQLRTYWGKHPFNFMAIQGLTECARQKGDFRPWLREIADEVIRQTNHRLDKAPPQLKIAYQYTLAVASYDARITKKSLDLNHGNPHNTGESSWPWLSRISPDIELDDPIGATLYIASLRGRDLLPEVREACRRILKKHPMYTGVRIEYADCFFEGVLLSHYGEGRTAPNVGQHLDQALQESEIVIRQKPECILGYYLAGLAARRSNPKLARARLQYFIAHSAPGTERYRFAKSQFDQLPP